MTTNTQLKPRIDMCQAEATDRLNMLANVYPSVKSDMNMLAMIYDYCVQLQLDPMSKPVHPVPMPVNRNGKTVYETVIMPGIVTYRIAASRTGEYLGHSKVEYGPSVLLNFCSYKGGSSPKRKLTLEVPSYVEMTVYRSVNGIKAEYPVRQYWTENYGTDGTKPWACDPGELPAPNAMWSKRITDQLVKCCESQALRHAFPEVCTGYTQEEMEGKEINMGTAEQVDYETEHNDDDILPPKATTGEVIQANNEMDLSAPQKKPENNEAPIDIVFASEKQIAELKKRMAIVELDESKLFNELSIHNWAALPADRVREASKYVRSQA